MNVEMWLTVGILATAVILFLTEKIRVDVVALGVVVALMLTNILTPKEALSGFSSTAVITIAALFIVGGAVMNTGLAGTIGRRVLSISGSNEKRLIVVLMGAVALLSGIMSDTGTVAVLLPAVIILAKNADIPPSKLLIPLSFGSLLGGAATLIGTPPNIIVSEVLSTNGQEPFTFFSFTPMGIILIIAGILFMLFIGRKLLPDRKTEIDAQRIQTPKELIKEYRLPEQLLRLRVRRGSSLIGKTIVDSGLSHDFDVIVLKIMRPPEIRPEFRFAKKTPTAIEFAPTTKEKATPIVPENTTMIELDDILIVKGDPDDVTHAAAMLNLGVMPAKPKDEKALISREVGVAEVVLPRRSRLLGRTLVDIRFGSRYKLSVLNISRPGVKTELELKETKLAFGDVLLVQGPWNEIVRLKDHRRDFVVMGQPEAMIEAPRKEKANYAFVIMIGMLILMITGWIPLVSAALLAAVAMVLTKCLTMDEAYEFIDWRSIILIAGMIPMSIALDKVGVVDAAAQSIVNGLGVYGPVAVLGGLFLFTSVFTQFLSNTATTVVVAPIGYAAAQTLGVSPQAFLMAIAIAASMAFATPIASPTNTLVMGAGNYRFSDYAKVGLPLIFIALILVLIFLPLLFPF